MFLVDKYAPKSPKHSRFHKELLKKLENQVNQNSMPHILLCGQRGTGKKTIVNMILNMIYGNETNDLYEVKYEVRGSNNKLNEVFLKQSNCHIIIEPNNNNFDKYIVQEVVKEYAKKVPYHYRTLGKFRTILINNIDNMSYYAQTSLRRTMEIYSDTCRFILWATLPTKVIEPIVSRCLYITLKQPSYDELFNHALYICSSENMILNLYDYETVLNNANGSIKDVVWQLDLIKNKINIEQKNDYLRSINILVSTIIAHDINQIHVQETNKKTNIITVRKIVYKIMDTNISCNNILIDVVNVICENNDLPDVCKIKIISIVAHYEHSMVKGRHLIMHIEACIIEIMTYLHDFEKQNPKYKDVFKKYYIEKS